METSATSLSCQIKVPHSHAYGVILRLSIIMAHRNTLRKTLAETKREQDIYIYKEINRDRDRESEREGEREGEGEREMERGRE